jgi:hypothetical protein
MNEKPLRRLHYYNGQRLEAADLKEEQEYHIRTRRWLNKSLYTAGIARGLEVRLVPGMPMVTVSPGLALDHEGREIILLDEEPLEVISFSGKDGTRVEGNYLVIEYGEDAHGQGGSSCVQGNSQPMYIGTKPKFSWVPYIPLPGSNQIVLAQVELKPGCGEVEVIGRDKRPLVSAAISAAIRQFALEGEREVAFIPKESFTDPKPSKNVEEVGRIYFHIRGSDPKSVSFHIKGFAFSVLNYTEIGKHSHSSNISSGSSAKTGPASKVDHHKHGANGLSVNGGEHSHPVNGYASNSSYNGTIPPTLADIPNLISSSFLPYPSGPLSINAPGSGAATFNPGTPPYMLRVITAVGTSGPDGQIVPALEDLGSKIGIQIVNTAHPHTINGNTSGVLLDDSTPPLHDHPITATISPTGVDSVSRFGNPLSYVDDLQVFIWRVQTPDPPRDEDNRTQEIIDQLVLFYPEWRQLTPAERKLGNGGAGHIFAIKGTGAIRLDFLEGLAFYEGEYCIEFRVKDNRSDANGGKIHYNLYIE